MRSAAPFSAEIEFQAPGSSKATDLSRGGKARFGSSLPAEFDQAFKIVLLEVFIVISQKRLAVSRGTFFLLEALGD